MKVKALEKGNFAKIPVNDIIDDLKFVMDKTEKQGLSLFLLAHEGGIIKFTDRLPKISLDNSMWIGESIKDKKSTIFFFKSVKTPFIYILDCKDLNNSVGLEANITIYYPKDYTISFTATERYNLLPYKNEPSVTFLNESDYMYKDDSSVTFLTKFDYVSIHGEMITFYIQTLTDLHQMYLKDSSIVFFYEHIAPYTAELCEIFGERKNDDY